MFFSLLCSIVLLGMPGSTPSRLGDQLATVEGAFKDVDGILELSSPLPTDDLARSDDPQRELSELVSCMDDARPSRILLRGRAVPVGMVCYVALTRVIYCEHPDQSGDIDPTWPGDVLPGASIDDLKRAKDAYLIVVKERAYVWV